MPLSLSRPSTSDLEIAPYYAAAAAYGVPVEMITLVVDPEVAAARNVHGVPIQGIKAMAERIKNRRLPPFWDINQTTITPTVLPIMASIKQSRSVRIAVSHGLNLHEMQGSLSIKGDKGRNPGRRRARKLKLASQGF